MGYKIPPPVIAIVSEILSKWYTHYSLNNLFYSADAPGVPPEGSKLVKCQSWLIRCNKADDVDAFVVLGKLLEDFMEREVEFSLDSDKRQEDRDRITKELSKRRLCYYQGGYIRKAGTSGVTKSLEQILKDKDLSAVDKEFERAINSIESDPPASITAACAIIESLCKVYIDEHLHLELPKKQSIKPLWLIVRDDLGFDPAKIEDEDLKKILTGIASITDGIGAIRKIGRAHV